MDVLRVGIMGFVGTWECVEISGDFIDTSPLAHATHGALFDRGLKRNIIAIVEIINKIKLNST